MYRDTPDGPIVITESEMNATFTDLDGEIADLEDDIAFAEAFSDNSDGSIDVMKADLAVLRRKRDEFEVSVYDDEPQSKTAFAVKVAGMFIGTFVLGASAGYYLGAAEAAAMIVGAK